MNHWLCLLALVALVFAANGHVLRDASEEVDDDVEDVLEDTPWSVVVQFQLGGLWYFICGGSLVSNDTVLTAAYCMQQGFPYRVLLGSPSYRFIEDTDTQVINVTEVTLAPAWKGANRMKTDGYYRDNLALLTLEKEAVMTDTVQTIELETEDEDLVGKDCFVAGHGYRQNPIDVNATRRIEELTIISGQKCQEMLNNEFFLGVAYLNSSSTFCTTDEDKGQCLGDWGNGLVCDDKLVGVVSFLFPRCNLGLFNTPVGYSRVSFYSDLLHRNF